MSKTKKLLAAALATVSLVTIPTGIALNAAPTAVACGSGGSATCG